MRAAVLGYHTMGRLGLEALLRHGFEVPLVITHRDDPKELVWWDSLAERAAAAGAVVVYRDDPNETGLAASIAECRPDFLFSFYYRHMLPPEVLSQAPRGALNLHGSLLPRYRGRAPVNWVLVHGESETGVTLHHMTAKPDAGDIVDQERVAISHLDTAYTLFLKLEDAASRLLDRALPALRDGTASAIAQDPRLHSYFGKRRPEDGRIEWAWPADRIYNLVRAVTHPYPGAFTSHRGRKLYVWWAIPAARERRESGRAPGCIVAVDLEGLLVATGDGTLRLVTVQIEGRPELPASAFALSERLAPGDRLGAEGALS